MARHSGTTKPGGADTFTARARPAPPERLTAGRATNNGSVTASPGVVSKRLAPSTTGFACYAGEPVVVASQEPTVRQHHARSDRQIHSGLSHQPPLRERTMPNRSAPPAPRSAEILADLAALANKIELNKFEIKKAEREAQQLLKVDAVTGYTALGAAASLRGDVEDVHAHHRRALNLSGESAEALHNYAASLTKLGEFAEALEIARRAYARAPADPEVLDCIVTASIFTGHFSEANELTRKWNRSNPERPFSPCGHVEGLLRAIDRNVFTEERLREVLTIAQGTLRCSKVRTSRVEVQANEDDSDSFLYECFVVAPPAKAEDLNDELDAQIRDRPHLMDDPGLKFMAAFIGASVDGSQPESTA